MSKISEKEWVEDFHDFVSGQEVCVPESVSQKILTQITRDLNPSSLLVFLKLLGIHSVVGTLSLLICNQFGMSPFGTEFSLSNYMMKFGHSACMVFCGVLFVGLSVSACRVILRPEEFTVLKKNALLQVFGLSMISLGVFAAAGAEIALTIGLFWLAGAMFGGMSTAFMFRRLNQRP